VPQWITLPLDAKDIESILSIENQSFSQSWRRRPLMAVLNNDDAITFCAKRRGPSDADVIIGYVIARLILNELHLLRIAVTPRWRRCGVAAELLTRCLTTAKQTGAEIACLEVRPSNRSARALYAKLGFQLLAERSRYYTDSNESALIFTKDLKEDA
jgi:ribosomal-protein-alanine N-acetyltransferase